MQRTAQWKEMGILERMRLQPLTPEQIAANRRRYGLMTDKLSVGRPPREVVLDRDGIPAGSVGVRGACSGNSWKASAELGGAISSLREWRKLKVGRDTLNEMVRETLAGATARLVDATPRIAEMLIGVALDEIEAVQPGAAADLIFRTIGTHLLEANQQEQLNAIREQLEQLENGGPVLDV